MSPLCIKWRNYYDTKMKAEFPGYFPITSEGDKAAWKDGLFSFDASVLLGLYRYSDETRQELLKLFQSLGGRIWITHQAAQEFLDGRLGVIGSQSKLYDDSMNLIDRVEEMFKSARGHPFLTKKLSSETEAHFKKLRSYLNGKKSYLDGLISRDPIQEEVAALFKGHIGTPFSKTRLKELFADGETRYKDKVPPGYEDAKKPEGSSRFGDLMMWFQLIEKGKKDKKPITFVTADEKEDWWKIFQGKTIGPRPELIAEFRDKAGAEFQIFSPERFMKLAGEKLSQDVKKAAIEEVKEVRKAGLSLGEMGALERLGIPRENAAAGFSFPLDEYSALGRLGLASEGFRRALAESESGKRVLSASADLQESLRLKALAEQEQIGSLEGRVRDLTAPRNVSEQK